MDHSLLIKDFVADAHELLAGLAPWAATQDAERLVNHFVTLAGKDYVKTFGRAIHHSATIERGAVLKGPTFVGPNCLVAAGAYLRGGVWLEGNNIIGPSCEVKSTFIFENSKIAHLSFVGDSVVGRDVNVEAGAMLANYRNEKADMHITFMFKGQRIVTGMEKFGCIVGDNSRVGANAVIAPGAALPPGSIVNRLELVDQS